MVKKKLRILGTRGIPAAHGGFETFAERLALYLARKDWQVTVYCQEEGKGAVFEDVWGGVRRVHIPVATPGAAGTIVFDWKSTWHAAGRREPLLTLGYNTAIFCAAYRLKGVPNLINMDGIEWRRQKWGVLAKTWFYLNEWAGCWLGNHLVADHPDIKTHLMRRVRPEKISMIPYGSDTVAAADEAVVQGYGLEPGRYAIAIARPEPENSMLEIVSAFSRRPRGFNLVVLGRYDEAHAYHKRVQAAASDEVRFLGAIYEKPVLDALRFHARFYVHGHQVGGTNPSLVEALGAGNAVLAHDNRFNRWVAGASGLFFNDEADCAEKMEKMLMDDAMLARLRAESRQRHAERFTWEGVLAEYEALLSNPP